MTEHRHFDYPYPLRDFGSRSEWEAYASRLSRNTAISLGLYPTPVRNPVKARIFDEHNGEFFTCHKVYMQSLPGLYITGNLFRPVRRNMATGSIPAILSPHGHWKDGRLHDHSPQISVTKRCMHFAQMGAAVFTWDMIGYNDSFQLTHTFDSANDPLWGLSLMGLQTLNTLCALDFVCSLPEVDSSRIGITGASGGATQSIAISAIDPRIAACAPICMVSCDMQGGCACENAPLLRIDATNVELVSLFAPKPLFVGSCTGDWTAQVPDRELSAIRRVYDFYELTHQLHNCHVDDRHNYNRQMYEATAGFFNRYLFGGRDTSPVTAHKCPAPPLVKMMVWWGKRLPASLSQTKIRELWRESIVRSLAPILSDPDAMRRTLHPALEHVLGIPAEGPGSCACRRGRLIYSIDADTLTVKRNAGRDRDALCGTFSSAHKYFTTYNRTPFMEDVIELITETGNHPGTRKLVDGGGAGMLCLLAAALVSEVEEVDIDLSGFNPDSDESWLEHCPLPSIRQIGGMETVLSMVLPRRINVRGAHERIQELIHQLPC